MWAQQKRVRGKVEGFADPVLLPLHISQLDTRSSSSRGGVTPAQSRPEGIAVYGPPSRNSESVHLGESLANPNVIVVDDNDDDGFGGG